MGYESEIKGLENILALPASPRFIKVAKIGERHEYYLVYRPLRHTLEGFPANDFAIEAYSMINKKPTCMGEYLAHEDADHSYEHDISHFVDLKPIGSKPNLPRLYWSSIKVKKEMQGKGLGGILLNELVDEFQRIKAAHIASFTEDGLKCIKKKFLDKGYQFMNFIKEVPAKYSDLSGWMFRDYRQR